MINTVISNRYLILSIAGVGGQAVVYKAQDQVNNRIVALKILKKEMAADDTNRRRFEREARTIAAVSHPNIVPLFDYGIHDDIPFIVMEFLECQSVKDVLTKRYYFTPDEALDIMIQLTDALAHAHEHGVIHRDIKPQNLLIKSDGMMKLSDFGIAVFENVSSNITEQDFFMGSVHYIAPETASGAPSSPQSDIYSLGITFFELLVGRVPFNGRNMAEIITQHMKEKLPPLHKINRNISKEIEAIIVKCCAKNRLDRFQSARDVNLRLIACRQGGEKKSWWQKLTGGKE